MAFLKEKNRSVSFLVVLVVIIFSCQQKQKDTTTAVKDSVNAVKAVSTNDYLITDTSFGAINKTTTYNDLVNLFGKNNLEDTINYAPEALDSFIVTKIYSNTPREIVVSWQTDKFHTAIAGLDFYQENSPYQTIDSLKVGSTLEQLVKVNGKRINFYGTGWDYGGIVTSYNNGQFHKSNIFFFLNSRDDASDDVIGDRELHTDLPAIKANLKKLYIAKMSLSLHNSTR